MLRQLMHEEQWEVHGYPLYKYSRLALIQDLRFPNVKPIYRPCACGLEYRMKTMVDRVVGLVKGLFYICLKGGAIQASNEHILHRLPYVGHGSNLRIEDPVTYLPWRTCIATCTHELFFFCTGLFKNKAHIPLQGMNSEPLGFWAYEFRINFWRAAIASKRAKYGRWVLGLSFLDRPH